MLWMTQITYWIFISLLYKSHEEHYCTQQVSVEDTLKNLLRETYVDRFTRPRLSRWHSNLITNYLILRHVLKKDTESCSQLLLIQVLRERCNWSYRCPIIILGQGWTERVIPLHLTDGVLHNVKIKVKLFSWKPRRHKGGEEMKLILNLGSRWRLVFTFTSRLLYRRKKSPRYQLNKTQREEERYLLPCLLTIPTT